MKTITAANSNKTNKVNDTSTVLKFYLWDDGVPQSITGKTATATIANQNGYLFDEPLTDNGYEVALNFASDNLKQLPAGDYLLEIRVKNSDNNIEVYPTEGTMTFTITQDLDEIKTDLTPLVTFDTILKSVDRKIDEYKQTIAKGKQGLPGEQGIPGLPGKQGLPGEQGVPGEVGNVADGSNLILGDLIINGNLVSK